MATLLGADLIVKTLQQEGIKFVFSLPGGQMNPIHFAIDEERSMDLVITRQEGTCALMAAGYAIASGKPACVMTTVGAGIAYEIGSLYYAFKERLPLISLAPQVQSYKMKPIQENLQACDQDEIFRPITKFNAIMYHRDRIPSLIKRAFKIALAPEPGPVHLDTPVDVIYGYKWVSKSKMKTLFPFGDARFKGHVFPDKAGVAAAVDLMSMSKKPLVLVGRNVERAKAGEKLEMLLDVCGIPAIPSTAAFASISSESDLHLGFPDLWDNEQGIERLSTADLLLIFEADEETARLSKKIARLNPGIKVIQSAELAAAIGSIIHINTGLMGSPEAIYDLLLDQFKEKEEKFNIDENWKDDLLSTKKRLEEITVENLDPGPRLDGIVSTLKRVGNIAEPGDYVICEGKTLTRAALVFLKRSGLHRTVMIMEDDIPGAGFPISLGIKLAEPKARIFLLTEAGQMKRHEREFQTQSRYSLGITTFLFQDKVKKSSHEVDFAGFARSLGVPAKTVIDPEEELSEKEIENSFFLETGMLFDASLS